MVCRLERELYAGSRPGFKYRSKSKSWIVPCTVQINTWNRELFLNRYDFLIGFRTSLGSWWVPGTSWDSWQMRVHYNLLDRYGLMIGSRTSMGSWSVPGQVWDYDRFKDQYRFMIGSRAGLGSWLVPGTWYRPGLTSIRCWTVPISSWSVPGPV